jgi:hypothetical protein
MTGALILTAGATMAVAARRRHIGMIPGAAAAHVLLAAVFWIPMH